jgi:outer membrane autotransporter protein
LTPEDKLGLSAEGIRKLEGERGIKSADVKPAKELTAHIANVSHNAAGRAVVTLDNGQVWRQSETRSSFEARAGDTAKITPGAMGSFWLSTSTHNSTRVERLP